MSRLQGRGIDYSAGDKPILQGVEIELRPGELLGLIGPNGAGKSTLLRILIGLLTPDRGQVLLDGQPLQHIAPRSLGRRVAYLAQQGAAHWPLEVERLVELGRIPHLGSWQQPGGEDRRAVEQAMASTDVLGLRRRIFNTLSGGEQMRVLLARALAVQPETILADEPVAALDPAHQLEVMSLFQQHCRQGGSAILVLHDLTLAAHYCDRLLLLHQGCKMAEGEPESVLTGENLRRVYNIALRPDLPASPLQLPWQRAQEGEPTQRT